MKPCSLYCTLALLLAAPLRAAPTSGELTLPDRALVGYLGHEPLVYRELTPLENLQLFARLYRVPERGERIGMLLERFGLWEVRHQRVGTFSRGMQQRLGLCRNLFRVHRHRYDCIRATGSTGTADRRARWQRRESS